MTYTVKEIFRTIQGEGAMLGTPAVFVRFAGCNLWSGREDDRASAICKFCDTDFVGGAKFKTPADLIEVIDAAANGALWVVLTGGEPALQVDEDLIAELHAVGFSVAIETNGTTALPTSIDWVCVSPKQGTELKVRSGDELKIVYPQDGLNPAEYANLDFDRFSLSPKDDNQRVENIKAAIEYCLENPRWHMTIQAHKYWGIR